MNAMLTLPLGEAADARMAGKTEKATAVRRKPRLSSRFIFSAVLRKDSWVEIIPNHDGGGNHAMRKTAIFRLRLAKGYGIMRHVLLGGCRQMIRSNYAKKRGAGVKKVMQAENPRVWFDDKKAASAKPRRGLLFHLFPLGLFFAVGTACAAPDFTINGNQLTAVNPNGSISITVPGHVTSIAENAFAGCGYVTSLTIPDSVTHLAESALYGCDGLRSLTLPYVPVSDSYGGSSIKLCGLERLFSRIASSRERTITPVGSVEFRIDPQG